MGHCSKLRRVHDSIGTDGSDCWLFYDSASMHVCRYCSIKMSFEVEIDKQFDGYSHCRLVIYFVHGIRR